VYFGKEVGSDLFSPLRKLPDGHADMVVLIFSYPCTKRLTGYFLCVRHKVSSFQGSLLGCASLVYGFHPLEAEASAKVFDGGFYPWLFIFQVLGLNVEHRSMTGIENIKP
jgi:hypothetical protein